MNESAHVTGHGNYSRLAMNRMGLWLFIVSEAALFAAFLYSRYHLTGTDQPEGLNVPLGFVITAILLSSSFFAYRSEKLIAKGDQKGFLKATLIAIGLGLLFLVGVGFEWREALKEFPPPDLFGTVFFTLTGLHAAHLISGLGLLAFVYLRGRRGGYTADDHWGVEGTVRYWHFVDFVWLFVFPTLYLV